MAEKEFLLTKEGYKKHEEELNYLKTVKRQEIAEKIKIAREFGDLSENAEYDEAKNEQALVEERITYLDNMLLNVKIIEEDTIQKDIISPGSKVVYKDLDKNKEMTFTIVGSAEADPFEGRISNESPVGFALIGKKKGDKISVETPGGIKKLEVIKVIR